MAIGKISCKKLAKKPIDCIYKIDKQLPIFSYEKPGVNGGGVCGIAGLIKPLGKRCGNFEPIKQSGDVMDPSIKSKDDF